MHGGSGQWEQVSGRALRSGLRLGKQRAHRKMATAGYLIEKFRTNEGDGVLGWRKKYVRMLQGGGLSGLTAQHKINSTVWGGSSVSKALAVQA